MLGLRSLRFYVQVDAGEGDPLGSRLGVPGAKSVLDLSRLRAFALSLFGIRFHSISWPYFLFIIVHFLSCLTCCCTSQQFTAAPF